MKAKFDFILGASERGAGVEAMRGLVFFDELTEL